MVDSVPLDESYDDFPRVEEAFGRRLDETLYPRGPESLFDLVRTVTKGCEGLAVDVGCGEGQDALRLAAEFRFDVLGVDPVERHVELARRAAQAAGLTQTVRFRVGRAEDIPTDSQSVALLWCREALMLAELDEAVREFGRVLRDDGVGVVYQVFTGPRMSDAEAQEFWGTPGASGASSVRAEDVEAAITEAGLTVRERVDYGSEWGEAGQEESGAAGRRLLHAARLLRDPARYIGEFGRANYEVMVTDCLWHVYRMIGKLHGAALVFTR